MTALAIMITLQLLLIVFGLWCSFARIDVRLGKIEKRLEGNESTYTAMAAQCVLEKLDRIEKLLRAKDKKE